jgi:hypothetical protein
LLGQPQRSLSGDFLHTTKRRHFRSLAARSLVSGGEFRASCTEGREFGGESMLDDFLISEIWARRRPETGCVSADTGSNPRRDPTWRRLLGSREPWHRAGAFCRGPYRRSSSTVTARRSSATAACLKHGRGTARVSPLTTAGMVGAYLAPVSQPALRSSSSAILDRSSATVRNVPFASTSKEFRAALLQRSASSRRRSEQSVTGMGSCSWLVEEERASIGVKFG